MTLVATSSAALVALAVTLATLAGTLTACGSPGQPTSAGATTTISGRTFTTYDVPAGTHDVVYERCTFTGGTSSMAVLTLDHACHGLTFRDCTIASGGGWNGITINVSDGDIHDVAFVDCRVAAQGRMGFECTGRPVSDTVGYQHIDLVGCTFAPQGGEAISYDGGAGCGACTIDHCIINGAGDSTGQQYGAGLEINGPVDITVSNTTLYGCRDGGFNLNCHAAVCAWTFQNDVVDFSQLKQSIPVDSSSARLILAGGMNGSLWTGCRFVLGSAWNAGNLRDCSFNDLSKSTITGSPPANQGRALWTLDAASHDNQLPVRLR